MINPNNQPMGNPVTANALPAQQFVSQGVPQQPIPVMPVQVQTQQMPQMAPVAGMPEVKTGTPQLAQVSLSGELMDLDQIALIPL